MHSLVFKVFLTAAVCLGLLIAVSIYRRGMPVDPKEFWKGRTVWVDRSARYEAMKRGRTYPPIPDEELTFSAIYYKGEAYTSGGPDSGPLVTTYAYGREQVFWENFFITRPKPPESIEIMQKQVANVLFVTPSDRRLHSKETAKDRTTRMMERDVKQFNYPPEAFSDEALFWRYVLEKRKEFVNNVEGFKNRARWVYDKFFNDLQVDARLITESLTENQLKAANAWKVKYLLRLRQEKEDESYIAAYLKAWNLSEVDLVIEQENQGQE